LKRFLSLLVNMLTPAQRRRFLLLQLYLLFVGAVQVLGVGSIAPFIALLSYPGLIHSNPVAQRSYELFGFASDRSFLIAFAFALMGLIIVSNVVSALGTWLTVSFSQRLGQELQQDIYRGYLHRNYVEFSRTNSASLISTLTQLATRFLYMVVQPLLNLISQAAVVLIIVVGLLWYRPGVAMSAFAVIGGGYLFIFGIVRGLLAKHGRILTNNYRIAQRLLTESLGGIKEIKLAGTEQLYEERLRTTMRSALHSESMMGLLADLPRFALESIAFCALLGLGAALLANTQNPGDVVGVLSLYAMTGYKLLPAAQNIFKCASQIRANANSVDELFPDIQAGRRVHAPTGPLSPAVPLPLGDIRCDSVWYTYPGTDVPVVRGVSFEIKRNSISVLVGPSGAGKSTVADLLLGLLHPTSGEIRVGDHNIAESIPSWQRNLGYVPQNIFILDDTVEANISFGSASERDLGKVRRAARMANIDEFVETLPDKYQFVVGERGAMLSGGQRQRIGIARALYHDAEVLIFDEATSALDSVTERDIITTINELKRHKTIVMIAHRLSTIRCADQVLLVVNGQLLRAGSFADVMENSQEFRELVAAGADDR
jgi:HlyD family secretion protein